MSLFERLQINNHPLIGVRIVETINNSKKIIRGILEHHERFNGKGYPNAIKGKDISLEGRIIAVADTYDALTSNRPYKRGYSRERAFNFIKDGSASHFDPEVVKAFAASFTKYPDVWNK